MDFYLATHAAAHPPLDAWGSGGSAVLRSAIGAGLSQTGLMITTTGGVLRPSTDDHIPLGQTGWSLNDATGFGVIHLGQRGR